MLICRRATWAASCVAAIRAGRRGGAHPVLARARAADRAATAFRKTKMREASEVERAHQAQKVCEAEHGHARHAYDRRKEN